MCFQPLFTFEWIHLKKKKKRALPSIYAKDTVKQCLK